MYKQKSTSLQEPLKGRISEHEVAAQKTEELKDHYKNGYRLLKKRAFKIVGSSEAAEDVVQEAFANTATAITRGAEIKNMGGWLARCVYNSSINYFDRQSQSPIPLIENLDLDDTNAHLERVFAVRRCSEDVFNALSELTPRQRSVFLLSELRGLKQREIAKKLKCSENSVSQMLLMAKGHIRRSVGPKRFAAVPVFWLLSRTYRFKERTHAYLRSTGAKAAHLKSKTSAFVRSSADMFEQPSTALMAGAAVVIVLGTSAVGYRQSRGNEDRTIPQSSVVTPTPVSQVSPAPAADNRHVKEDGNDIKGSSPAAGTLAKDDGSTPASIVGHGDSRSKKLNLKVSSENSNGPPKLLPTSDPTDSGGNETIEPAVAEERTEDRKIAFTTNRDGDYEIYSINGDGSGQANLSNAGIDQTTGIVSQDIEPSLSGYGSKLAFTSTRIGNADDVYSMNSDGSGQTRLTNDPGPDSEPSFAQDGSKIAFRSGPANNNEVYSMNVDGSGQASLTNNPATDGAPAWSPDGLKIAFESDRDGNNEIYSMSADGEATSLSNLTNTGASEVAPDWSPDGTKIVFETFRDATNDIYVMNADGTGQTRLTTDPGSDRSPEWSPDGTQIVFQSDRDGNDEIYVMNADGSGETNISQSPSSEELAPTW